MKREKIVQISKEVGIDLIGFTDEDIFIYERNILKRRKEKGLLSPFQVYTIEENTDPLKVWDKTKGIISVGISYNHLKPIVEYKKSKGKIARIAWGMDYHQVLLNKMIHLMDKVNNYKEIDYRAYVDTGPLLDRAAAYRSGIGFYGKNGFIINKKYGSYIALGHVLIDSEIQWDNLTSWKEPCENCSRCIQFCPTGALKERSDFSPHLCISYMTQKKEILNLFERKALRDHLYGCDICQEVCPYNQYAKISTEDAFRPKEEIVFPRLEDILFINNAKFKNIYRNTAAGWRGKKLLQRNAVIIAGNIKTEENFHLLLKSCKDLRPEIRLYSLFSLNEYGIKGKDIIQNNLGKESLKFKEVFYEYLS